jgi:hypothetical protein
MGMKRASMKRFLQRSQKVLEDLWPGTVVVDGQSYPAAVGAYRGGSVFQDAGEVSGAEMAVRVSGENLKKAWAVGTRLIYRDESGEEHELRVMEVSGRVGESAWHFRCGPADE